MSAGQDVRVLQIEVVAGAVQIGRHQRDRLESVFAPKRLTHLHTGDLGDGIPLVGELQRTGQQIVLFDGLRRQFGIDAARSQEHEFADPRAVRRVDDVVLD